MANPNPSPATRFQPGHRGTGGRRKGSLRKDDVQAVMGRLCRMTRAELQAIVDSPTSQMLDISVASIFLKAAASGDHTRMTFLLDRMIGKVKDEILVRNDGDDEELRRELAAAVMSDDEAAEAAEKLAMRVAEYHVRREEEDRYEDDGDESEAAPEPAVASESVGVDESQPEPEA